MQEFSGPRPQQSDVNQDSSLRQEFEEFKRMAEDRFKVLEEKIQSLENKDNHQEYEVPPQENNDNQDSLSPLSSISSNYIDNIPLPNPTQETSSSEPRRSGRLNN